MLIFINTAQSIILETQIHPAWKSRNPYSHSSSGSCYDRVLSGYRHFSSASRDATSVTDRDDCAYKCSLATYCKSFSYHYFVAKGVSDNCVLSPLAPDEWDQSHDLVLDSNWDVYGKSTSTTSCHGRGFDGEDEKSHVAKSLLSNIPFQFNIYHTEVHLIGVLNVY